MTSTARVEANRRNAKRSTGPRTLAGKERAKMNGLRHGLRAEEAVLPTEDRDAFDDHMAAWLDDWKPQSVTRRLFVERAALAAWRLKRCVRAETERLSDRATTALAEWDDSWRNRYDQLVAAIVQAPFDSVCELEQTRSGVDRLIALWETLLDTAGDRDGWTDQESHHQFFILLRSADPELDGEDDNAVYVASWRLLLTMRPDLAAAHAGEGERSRPLDTTTAAMTRLQIAKMGQIRIDRLRRLRAILPDDAVLRSRYAEAEALRPHREDASLQRYEARHDREARAAVTMLIALHKSGADLVDEPLEPLEPEPSAQAPSEPQPARASKAPSEPKPEAAATSSAAKAPSEPNTVGSDVVDMTITPRDRDRGGRSWPTSGGPEAPIPSRNARKDQ